MKKPTLEDIKKYDPTFEDAEKFYFYYESVGWVVGRKPMKKWRAALAGWKARNIKKKIDNKGFSAIIVGTDGKEREIKDEVLFETKRKEWKLENKNGKWFYPITNLYGK